MIEDVVAREEISNYSDKTNTSRTIAKTLMSKLHIMGLIYTYVKRRKRKQT